MPRPQVSIRLATDGKAQVKRDFVEIADDGGAQAARLRAKWEAETSQIEKLTDRAAKTAARLASVSATPIQQRIGAATGIAGDPNGAARASASALAAELDRAETEARQLIAAIDPLFGAQLRYSTNVDRINDLKALGVIDGQRYNQLLAAEEQALDAATRAAARNATMRNSTRMGMQQLSFQVGDVSQQLALGTNASIIFAQQSGQVIQALQIMGGEGNAFLRFLGGPWGIALATAAVVLTPLIGKLLETGEGVDDLVEKMRKEADQARAQEKAENAWKVSLEGVEEALRKNRQAMKELEESHKTLAQRTLEAAAASLSRLKQIKSETSALIDQARAELEVQRIRASGPGQRGELAALGLPQKSGNLDALQTRIGEINADIAEGERQLRAATATFVVEQVGRLMDPVERIKDKYDGPRGLITLAKERAVAEGKTADEIARQAAELEKLKRGEIAEAQKAARGTTNRQFGRQVSGAEAASIARAAGLQVNSVDRSFAEQKRLFDAWVAAGRPADNPVAPPGSSAHEGARGRWALDIQFGQGVTPELLKRVFAAQGVNLTKVFKERGHFHVEGSRSDAASADRTAEAEAEKAVRLQNDFEERRARLNEQMLRAQGEMLLSYEQQAKNARDQIAADFDQERIKIRNDVEEKKLSEAQAEELNLANERLLFVRLFNQTVAERARQAQEADATAANEHQLRLEGLQYQEEIARTAAERRDVGEQILELVYEERKRHLEYLKAQAERNGQIEEANRIQAQINALPEQRARDSDRNRRSTMGPGEEFLDRLPSSLREAQEAIEGFQVQGLQALSEGLGDAVMNAEDLGDVFDNLGDLVGNVFKRMIAQLIELGFQMLVLQPIAKELFGSMQGSGGGTGESGGGGGGGGGWAGGLIGLVGSVIGSIFGGGGSHNPFHFGHGPQPGGGMSLGGSQGFVGPAFATGTHYAPGGLAWVGEFGRELVDLPRGSKVYTAGESRRMAAANDVGQPINITNNNDFRGADPQAQAAIEARLDQMERELPGRVVAAYQDAKQRFVIR